MIAPVINWEMMSAVGNFTAVVTALGLALGSAVAARREAHRRALAALATALAVIDDAMDFAAILGGDAEQGSVRREVVANHLKLGRIHELRAMIAEVRPTDMPTIEAAKSWIQVRTIVRSLDGVLSEIARTNREWQSFDGDDWRNSLGRIRLRISAEASYFERRLRVLPSLPHWAARVLKK